MHTYAYACGAYAYACACICNAYAVNAYNLGYLLPLGVFRIYFGAFFGFTFLPWAHI